MKVVYQVLIVAKSEQSAEKLVKWLNEEHVDDLLKVPGCLSGQVTNIASLSYECRYIFENSLALQVYYDKYAVEMRAKAQAIFEPGELEVNRCEQQIILEKHNGI